MKRWGWSWLVALFSAISVFMVRSSGFGLLRDTDTAVLLRAIRARQNPMSWFWGDWPLANHFYRPLPTLAFELDNWLYRDQAWGYGATNAIICSLCVLLTFWFLRELTDRPALSAGATVIYALWHQPSISFIENPFWVFFGIAVSVAIYRQGKNFRAWVPMALVWLGTVSLLTDPNLLHNITLQWLPGRTATVMTVFCMISLASYARYERLARETKPREFGPLDPPATSSATTKPAPAGVIWPVLSVVAALLAFCSYEQAVMLPACLLAVACTYHWRGHRVRWGWQLPFWGLLIAYILFRHQIIPQDSSRYQNQQFRNGPGVYLSLIDYLFPGINSIQSFLILLESGWIILITAAPYFIVFNWVRDVVTLIQARRQWLFAFAGWGMSFIAYLPMAWLKQFDHYHYWPLAMRALLVATLTGIAIELTVTAWSRPGVQAPPRSSPAPGSLPRP